MTSNQEEQNKQKSNRQMIHVIEVSRQELQNNYYWGLLGS